MAKEYYTLAQLARATVYTDDTNCIAAIKLMPIVSTKKLIPCNTDYSMEQIQRLLFSEVPGEPGCYALNVDVGGLGIEPPIPPSCVQLHSELLSAVIGDTYAAPFAFEVGSVFQVYQNGVLLTDGIGYTQDPVTGLITWLTDLVDCQMTFVQLPCQAPVIPPVILCDYNIPSFPTPATIFGIGIGGIEYLFNGVLGHPYAETALIQADIDAAILSSGAVITSAVYAPPALAVIGSDTVFDYLLTDGAFQEVFIESNCNDPVIPPVTSTCDYLVSGLPNNETLDAIDIANQFKLININLSDEVGINAALVTAFSEVGATYTSLVYDLAAGTISVIGSDMVVNNVQLPTTGQIDFIESNCL